MVWKVLHFNQAFSLSKCDFSSLFHTERSWRTYRFTVVFVSGRQDLPSDGRAFSLTSFKASSFLLRLNKGLIYSPKCLLDLNS